MELIAEEEEPMTEQTNVGYKETAVGMVPEDWDVIPLGDFLKFKNGLNKESKFFGFGTPIVNYMDVYGHKGLRKHHIKGLVSLTAQEILSFNVKRGDVFFTRTSETAEEIGVSAVLLDDIPNGVFSGFILRARPFNSKVFIQYNKYCYSAEVVRKQIVSTSSYTTRALTNGRLLSNVLVPLPPTHKEQQAIATALGDVDDLISSLDSLIAKKKNIKQGAMQQLLSGKTRLLGFGGEWELMSLEQLVDSLDNLRVPLNSEQRLKMKGDIPYCGANGIVDYVNDFVIDDDIILMAEDGGYFDEYKTRPIAYRIKGKCWVNNHAHIIKAKPFLAQSFLFYSLVNKNILDYISGGTMAKLNKSEMFKIEIWVPPLKAEQDAICIILEDMDNEIEALEARLAKYQGIKQGMMQELLTGKTRLV